jgi:excisionase family DNA binding protein
MISALPRAEILSARQAAEYLGLSHVRVRVLLLQGRIPARKIGQDWVIYKSDLEKFARKPRPAGRPKF